MKLLWIFILGTIAGKLSIIVTNLRFNLPYHPDELKPEFLAECRATAMPPVEADAV